MRLWKVSAMDRPDNDIKIDIVEVLSRAFYAMHDTKTPVLVGVFAMALNVAFSVMFAALFRALGWLPLGGLALANSLATGLEMVGLSVLMRKRLHGLEGKSILGVMLRSVVAVTLMVAIVWGWLQMMDGNSIWLVTLGGVLIGGSVYLLILYFLKVPEIKSLRNAISQRLKS